MKKDEKIRKHLLVFMSLGILLLLNSCFLRDTTRWVKNEKGRERLAMKLFMEPMPWEHLLHGQVYYHQPMNEFLSSAAGISVEAHHNLATIYHPSIVESGVYLVGITGKPDNPKIYQMARMIEGFSLEEVLNHAKNVHGSPQKYGNLYTYNIVKKIDLFAESMETLMISDGYLRLHDAQTNLPILSENGRYQYAQRATLMHLNERAETPIYAIPLGDATSEAIFISYTWREE